MAFSSRDKLGLWISAAALFVTMGVGWYEKRQTRRTEEAQTAVRQALMVSSLDTLSSRFRADADWDAELAGHVQTRMAPILTVELQRVWQSGRPILFIGKLKDMAQVNGGNYKLELEYDGLLGAHIFVSTNLSLTAECTPELAQPLLDMVREPNRLTLFADTAVIGTVQSVKSEESSTSVSQQRFTGEAQCLAVMALKERVPPNWRKLVGRDVPIN